MAALGTLALAGAVRAAIVVPGANGTDGALNITANTVIDLSQAVTGQWDNDNSANAGKGAYDPAKWAVVFKYTEVNIAAGATVTFKNHASRAPVVWLVSGNVTVSGALTLDGQPSQGSPILAEPGPGGFRGGVGRYGIGFDRSSGFGPGGGGDPSPSGRGGRNIDNPSLVPLIGGGGGGGSTRGNGGGGGGGSILIAAVGTVSIAGSLSANGGAGFFYFGDDGNNAGGGAGGSIRIVTSNVEGTGSIVAVGGENGGGPRFASGYIGRVRVERVSTQGAVSVIPDPSAIILSDGATALLWPPIGAPEVRVLSIGAISAPADPRAGFGTIGADVALPITASTQVLIETKNVEQASQVKVRGTPRSNGNFTEVVATVDSIVSTDPLVIRWKADLPVNVGYSAVQAHVIRP